MHQLPNYIPYYITYTITYYHVPLYLPNYLPTPPPLPPRTHSYQQQWLTITISAVLGGMTMIVAVAMLLSIHCEGSGSGEGSIEQVLRIIAAVACLEAAVATPQCVAGHSR